MLEEYAFYSTQSCDIFKNICILIFSIRGHELLSPRLSFKCKAIIVNTDKGQPPLLSILYALSSNGKKSHTKVGVVWEKSLGVLNIIFRTGANENGKLLLSKLPVAY